MDPPSSMSHKQNSRSICDLRCCGLLKSSYIPVTYQLHISYITAYYSRSIVISDTSNITDADLLKLASVASSGSSAPATLWCSRASSRIRFDASACVMLETKPSSSTCFRLQASGFRV